MKYLLYIILTFIAGIAKAQDSPDSFNRWQIQGPVELYSESEGNMQILYVSNNACCPVSVQIDLSLANMVFSGGKETLFIISAKSQKVKIGELTIIDKAKKAKFSYSFTYSYGNILQSQYDTAFNYDLPYKAGNKFLVKQGYGGVRSHKNTNALDFAMPQNTTITAAREGVVIAVLDSYETPYDKCDCMDADNFVLVYHSDGTIAEYTHLNYKGASVKEGEFVERGARIGYCGKNGHEKESYFHFGCLVPRLDGNDIFIPTRFKINDGKTAVFLKENTSYLKNY